MKNCSKLGSVHKPRKQSIPFITECSVGKKKLRKSLHTINQIFDILEYLTVMKKVNVSSIKDKKKGTVIRNAVGKTKLSKQFQVHI